MNLPTKQNKQNMAHNSSISMNVGICNHEAKNKIPTTWNKHNHHIGDYSSTHIMQSW
jgi:hypothetical protein